MIEALQKKFAKAGLELRKAPPLPPLNLKVFKREADKKRALVAREAAEKIFGMGVLKNRNKEFFSMQVGDEDNRVEVLNTDAGLKQLVLLVSEPARKFEETVSRKGVDAGYITIPSDAKVIRRDEKLIHLQRTTPGEKRHFLCGIDERGSFMAQLPKGISTVKGAHAVLKAPQAAEAQKRGVKVHRQGEWFFIAAAPVEKRELEDDIKKNMVTVYKKMNIAQAINGGRRVGGNSHTADEVVVRDGFTYVRGKIKHPEHHTKTFNNWTRVFRNTEKVADGVARMRGISWID